MQEDIYEARFPHCDSRLLHAPLECVHCDHYPEMQQERIANKINFTGHYDKDKEICPAEVARNLPNIERWPGNRPRKEGEEGTGYFE